MIDKTQYKDVFIGVSYKSLTDEEKQLCEGFLIEYDGKQAIDTMQNKNIPGSDGFTV